jgi:hypothetical protein
MARKKTAKPKEVVVRVKVSADGKPRRNRRVMVKQVKRGGGDIAQVGRTETLYRPYYPPPQPAPVMDATLPEQFRRQSPQVAGLLEDVKQVKQERANLLKDIERQTEQQIVQYVAKQQGAEQKGELAKAGAFDPFNAAEYEKPAPRIDEIDEGEYVAPFQSVPFIEDISPKQPVQTKQKPKLKVVEKLPEAKPVMRERPPVPLFTEPERAPSLTDMFVRAPIVDSELDTEVETEVDVPVREKRRPRTKEEETSLLEKSKAKALQAGLPERIEPRLGKIQRDDKKQLARAIYDAQRRSGIVISGADIQRLYGIKPGSVMNLVRKIEKGESLD